MVQGRQRVSSGGGSTPLSPKSLIRKRAMAAHMAKGPATAAAAAGPGEGAAGAEEGPAAAGPYGTPAAVGVWQGYGPSWEHHQQQHQQQLIGAHTGFRRERSGLRITSGGASGAAGSSSSLNPPSGQGPSDGGAASAKQQQQQSGGCEAPAAVAAMLGTVTAAVVRGASLSGGGAAATPATAAGLPLSRSHGAPVEGLGRQVSAVQLALIAYLSTPGGKEALRASGSSSQGGAGRLSGSGRGSSTGLPAMPFAMLQSLAFTCTDLTGSRPVAELAAIASLPRLTSLEITRCHQLSDAAVWKLTALKRLARLKLANVWSLTDFGLEGLASLSGLTSLTLMQPNQASARGLLALTGLTRLQSLTLAVTQELGSSALPWLVCELPSLRGLDLTSGSWTDGACEELAAGAAHLTSLKLRSCEQLSQAGLAQLAKLPSLQALLLEGCKGVSCGQVLGQGQLPKGLASLALKGCSWGNMFTECLEVPACLSSLTSLNLSGDADVNEQQLRKALGFFPGLRELNLSGSLGESDGALTGLGKMKRLRHLDLSGTRAQGLFLEGLAAGQLGELKELSMRGCNRLGDAGLRLVVQQLPGLEVLDVAEAAGVTDRGVGAVMEGSSSLVRLDVSGCKGLTREVVQLCPHYLRLLHTIK